MADEPRSAARMAQKRQSTGRLLEGAEVWSQDPTGNGLPVSSDAQRSLSPPWREEHRAEDSRGPGTEPASAMEAWRLFP